MKLFPLAFLLACGVAPAADVLVLDGTDANFMHDALRRIACPFDHAAKLDANHRIAILCGKNVSADAKTVADFLQSGGHLLAVGGGAKWMLDAKLFDAAGYYPTGTTEHMSTFAGYHRLMFGYPVAKPRDNWLVGVPSLLRATGGPLMRPGPKATSILGAGDPFSLAAFQHVGKGIALLIGADPQGGNEFLSIGKPTPKRGDELGTDMLLANAIAWLRDPACNLIPNSGFEENAETSDDKSHWEITLNNGARSQWQRSAAPEGKVCLMLEGTKANSIARVSSYRPIIVERGAQFTLSFRHQGTTAWKWEIAHLASPSEDARKGIKPQPFPITASGTWAKSELTLTIPNDAPYLALTARLDGIGTLALDDITLKRALKNQ